MSKIKVKQSINYFTLSMMNVVAIVNLANLSVSAKHGFSGLFYLIAGSIFFFIPLALISAELATGWPQRGGVYIWVREALGENLGFLAIWLQWIENVIWYPTALSFAVTSFAYIFNPTLSQNKLFIMIAIMVIFWAATIVNFFGMELSSWISTISAIFGTLIPGIAIISLGCIWFFLDKPSQISFTFDSFIPKINDISQFALLSGVLMSLSGLEMTATHASEVKTPQKTFPLAMLISSVIIISVVSLGSLSIASVIPADKIELAAGPIIALSFFFQSFNLPNLTPLIAALLTVGALGMISTWTIGPIKGMYATSEHGDLPIFMQKTNKYGVPTTLLIIQAIIVSILSLLFLYMPTISSSYWMLFNLTAHLYQIMYILMFISALVLRYKKPNIARGYKIPLKNIGIWFVSLLGIFGTGFAIIVGYFPTTRIHGISTFFFEIFLIGGTILFCVIPFIIRYFRNDKWLEHFKKNNK